MAQTNFILTRDCRATLIPSGDVLELGAGTKAMLVQALGGTVTVQARGGLYRIGSGDLDALGEGAEAAYGVEEKTQTRAAGAFSDAAVWDALRTCFDPEIPVNIVDLGLIYDLHSEEGASGQYQVFVKMTLTAQGCGMGPSIAADAREKIESLPEVGSAQVDIVWDPVWNPHMISPEGRKILGLD